MRRFDCYLWSHLFSNPPCYVRSGPGGSKEPVLPFPPPKPFIPLNSHKLDSQIGLLRPFYRSKFDKLRESSGPHPLPPTTPSVVPDTENGSVPFNYSAGSSLSLSDDQPSLLRQKMGPNGQVTVPTSAAAASAAARKKKAAAADGGSGAAPKVKNSGATAAKGPVKKKNPKVSSPKKNPMASGPGNGVQPPPPPRQPPPVLAS